MQLFIEISKIIWFWYLPAFLLWTFVIWCINHDTMSWNGFKVKHLFCSLFMGLFGWVAVFIALLGILVSIDDWMPTLLDKISSKMPKKWREVWNSKL